MAFGDSILSKFDPDPIEMMDPAYEGVGELEDVDDEVDDFIDQIAYGGAFESVMPATECDIDCDDDDCDDECDEDDLDEDDDDLEDFLDDENEFFGEDGPDLSEVEESAMCMLNPDACCAAFEATVKAKAKRKGNNNFAKMTPAQRRQMFVKMIMNNRKLSAADKKARIAKYDANHPATEALSAILPNDDTTINDGEDIFADILDNAYNTSDYPDPALCDRARHSASLQSSTQCACDMDALIHDLVFSGDKQASHSANLKTSYAKESYVDDDDFFYSLTDANESSVMVIPYTASVRTEDDSNKSLLRKVRRLISDYKQMKPGVDKDAYGNMVAKFISNDIIVELLMDTGEWDKIPTELKRKYKSKTGKRARKLGRRLKLKRMIFPKSASKESAMADTEQLDLLHSSVENSLYSFLETINSLD